MSGKRNLFDRSGDLAFLVDHMIDWETVVPLMERGFQPDPDRPFDSTAEAVELYRDLLSLAGGIAGTRILPRAEGIDREQNRFEEGRVILHPEVVRSLGELAEAGLLAMTVDRPHGGLNIPSVISFMATELVSYAESAVMNITTLNEGVADLVEEFGSPEQIERWIPPLISGEWTAAMALTEPEAGSDLGRISSRAFQQDGRWLVRGRKRFITNGCGEVLLLLVRTEEGTEGSTKGLSMVICRESPGVEIIALEHKLGIRGSATCEMVFQDAPCELVGARGSGFKQMLRLMNAARLSVSSQAVGIGQRAYDEAIAYARERVQMDRPIAEHPPVTRMLESMKVSLEAQRAMLYRGVEAIDLQRGARRVLAEETDPTRRTELESIDRRATALNRALVPLVKYYCAEESIRIASLAIQVMGGNGYMTDYPVERLLRDARVTSIYEGTSEIQVLMAMKDILGGKMTFLLEEIATYCRDHAGEEAAPVESASEEPEAEFEYSAGAYGMDEGEAPAGEPLPEILDQAREHLVDAAQFLMGTVVETGDDGYARLRARDLADLAVYVAAGYELLKQAEHSDRKRLVADRWLRGGQGRAGMLHRRIVEGGPEELERARGILGG